MDVIHYVPTNFQNSMCGISRATLGPHQRRSDHKHANCRMCLLATVGDIISQEPVMFIALTEFPYERLRRGEGVKPKGKAEEEGDAAIALGASV